MDKRRKSLVASMMLIAAPTLVDVGLIAFFHVDIAKSWPLGDWPGNEWQLNWPAALFWGCLICVVLFSLGKLVVLAHNIWKTKTLGERFKPGITILRHLWTIGLFAGGGLFLVYLPFDAIVAHTLWFWALVTLGLVVAFICSASELAFATACGVNKKSKVYQENVQEQQRLLEIFNDSGRKEEERISALKKAEKLGALIRIGEDYSSKHNPTLVVATNVANMLVAVVSTVAIYDHANPKGVGRQCSWAAAQSPDSIAGWLIEHLSLRCVNLWGSAWVPFPVNTQIFQTALALTLILIIGEMIPKQLATAFPRKMCFPRLYRFIGFVFGLGVGPSFGVFSEFILNKFEHRLKD